MPAPDTTADESTRRLRAVVRAALSTGVWSVIAMQMLMAVAMRLPASDDGAIGGLPLVLLLLATAGVLYGTAGTSAALAAARDRVSVGTTLAAGQAALGPFLWLLLKAGLLTLAVMQLVFTLIIAATGVDPNAAMTELPSQMLPVAAALGFVLVYWMPVVFYRRDFRLFATLREALQLAHRRLAAAGFLALLTLAPAALAWGLGGRGGIAVAFLLQAIASLLAWTAYIYCVEWLQDAPPTATQQTPIS